MIERLTQIAGYRGYGLLNEHGAYLEGSYNHDLGSALGKSIFELQRIVEDTIGNFNELVVRGKKGAIFIARGHHRTCFTHTLKSTNYGLIRKIIAPVVQ
ncbi:MAG TPA: hypothetical protein EYP58_00110 [bacterium (Candidatus Stahlbacteria)]|nr:hypothetical protein [Candidatus Stahlbacteria bacterium]